jgi:hypothetical protein
VIFIPQTVTVFLDKPIVVDVNTIKIELPENDLDQSEDQENQMANDLMRGLMKEAK